MTCTTSGCENPSEDLYLCDHCIQDFNAWIDQIPLLLPELDVTIARLDHVRTGNNEGGNGSKSSGSAAPLNIDAVQLKINLNTVNQRAHHYAKDPHAARMASLLAEWITKAELLISGPQEDKPSRHDLMQAAIKIREEVPEELPVPALIEWLKNVHRMDVKPSRIWQWAKRGHITRTNATGQAKYSPTAVLIHARKEQLQRHVKAVKV